MTSENKLTGKKVVLVIAPKNFRDEEFEYPRQILTAAGVKVVVASVAAGQAQGALGATAKVDLPLDQVKLADFDGIVFIGGAGCRVFWENPKAHSLIQEFYKSGKLTAGICSASVTLANAGVLKGKKATVFSGEAQQLISAGAIYKGNSVEIDGNIITADGPGSAKDFGRALAEYLASR